MLRCVTCKARFSERKSTVFFGARLSPEKVESVLEHVAEGCGVRQTGRLCKVNRYTVGRYSRLAGEHARDLQDELVVLSLPERARSSSTRSGTSWPRRRRIAIPLVRRVSTREISGKMWRSIPRVGWS
jgi:LacI family transcriptional regulator